MVPSQDEIRDELGRVLGSEPFAGAGRHSRLLEYLVERTLAGEGDRLKEYVLGTEVLGRPDDYDPRVDSIVRVEVRRLRRRLEAYYRGVGAGDRVLISIPRGRYAPAFSIRDDGAIGRGAAPVRTSRRWIALAGVGAAAAAAAILAAVGFDGSGTAGRRADVPGIAVLPFEHYSTRQADALLAARMADEVAAELARIETVSVASRTSTAALGRGARRLPEIAGTLGVRYVMEATATPAADGRHRVVVRLVDAARDRKIWVGEYTVAPQETAAVARTIAGEAAAAVQQAGRGAPSR